MFNPFRHAVIVIRSTYLIGYVQYFRIRIGDGHSGSRTLHHVNVDDVIAKCDHIVQIDVPAVAQQFHGVLFVRMWIHEHPQTSLADVERQFVRKQCAEQRSLLVGWEDDDLVCGALWDVGEIGESPRLCLPVLRHIEIRISYVIHDDAYLDVGNHMRD